MNTFGVKIKDDYEEASNDVEMSDGSKKSNNISSRNKNLPSNANENFKVNHRQESATKCKSVSDLETKTNVNDSACDDGNLLTRKSVTQSKCSEIDAEAVTTVSTDENDDDANLGDGIATKLNRKGNRTNPVVESQICKSNFTEQENPLKDSAKRKAVEDRAEKSNCGGGAPEGDSRNQNDGPKNKKKRKIVKEILAWIPSSPSVVP